MQPSANQLYRFASWSDGGARNHNFVAPATPATYTATYVPKRNLARGRPALASSVYLAGREASKAVDGSMATAWSSARTDPQWFRVDLGSVQVVNRVLLNWLSTAYAKSYQIQVSGQRADVEDRVLDDEPGTAARTASRSRRTTPGTCGSTRRLVVLRGATTRCGSSGCSRTPGRSPGSAGKCVDIYQAATADGTPTTLYTCKGAANQQWTPVVG